MFCSTCIGWLLLCLFFVALHDIFIQWNRYDVRQIQVDGNSLISREEVLAIARLTEPINVFRVNPFLLAKRLRDDARVQFADVSISWPDQIRIRILERKPLAIIRMEPPVIVDVEGACFQATNAASLDGVPEIEGLGPEDFPGTGMPATEAYRETIHALVTWTRENGSLTSKNIDRIRIDPDIGLTVIPKHPISGFNIGQIHVGYRQYPEKSALLDHLIQYMNQIRVNPAIEWIDLTDMKRIVVKPAGTETGGALRKEK